MNTDEERADVIDALAYPCPSVSSVATLLPLPAVPITVRVATLEDLPFIDGLQKKQSKAVGWMPTRQLEGKIAKGEILVASAPRRCSGVPALSEALMPQEERVGYLIGSDRYFKRDDVGIIYAINVLPGRQRGLIGATLLRAQFERSAYGCRLYCCWCAQDLAANRFWEAMGFTPLAFRTGSPTKGAKGEPRTHIFWQRRIRSGDTGDASRGGTPWWFPSQTTGGSIREDRLVLPIPPGVHWSDAKPIVLPGMDTGGAAELPKRLPGRTRAATKVAAVEPAKSSRVIGGGLQFGSPIPVAAAAEAKPKRERRAKQKNDPKLVAAARELRDRWLEAVNAAPQQALCGKYDVSRACDARLAPSPRESLLVEQVSLALPAPIAA